MSLVWRPHTKPWETKGDSQNNGSGLAGTSLNCCCSVSSSFSSMSLTVKIISFLMKNPPKKVAEKWTAAPVKRENEEWPKGQEYIPGGIGIGKLGLWKFGWLFYRERICAKEIKKSPMKLTKPNIFQRVLFDSKWKRSLRFDHWNGAELAAETRETRWIPEGSPQMIFQKRWGSAEHLLKSTDNYQGQMIRKLKGIKGKQHLQSQS